MDRRLKAFLAVARLGNLTAAANKVGLTQPALTKTIRRLEEEMGATLFIRSPRGMALTETGSSLLDHAHAIETHWAQAREVAHARAGGRLAEFRIASGPAYHLRIVPLLARQLSLEFPETKFILDFDVAGAMIPKLISGELHLLLGAFVHEVPEGIVTRQLLEVASGIMCCRKDPLAEKQWVTPGDMRGRRWVVYRRDVFLQQQLKNYFLRHQIPAPEMVMEVEALISSMTVVSGTSYLTAGPTTLEPLSKAAGLKFLPLREPFWSSPSGAWMRESMQEYPIVRRALEMLHELCEPHFHSPELLLTPK